MSATIFEVAEGISIWYAPAGLALSLLVLLGPRFALVVFVTNLLGAVVNPGIDDWWDPWLFPALITLNLTGVAMLVRRAVGPKLLPGTTRETVVFTLTAILAPALLALSGTMVGILLDLIPAAEVPRSLVQWWVGDASGMLTVVPVAMVFGARWMHGTNTKDVCIPWNVQRVVSFLPKVIALVGCLWAAFAIEPLPQLNAFYLCFLPLVWICLRHGLPGGTLATLVITMGSLIGLRAVEGSNELIIGFLFFELTVVVVGLGLGATVSRRDAVEKQLADNEARFDRVITGAQVGLWDWNLSSGDVTYNQRCSEMLGLPLEQLARLPASWEQLAHEEDRPKIAAALQAHLVGQSALYEVEFRVRTRDERWRWIHSRGSIVARDLAGKPEVISGTHLDISDRKDAETQARRLLEIVEVTTDFVATTDCDGRVLHANASLLQLLGCADLGSIRGQSLLNLVVGSDAEKTLREAMSVALAGSAWHGELTLRADAGREVPVSIVVLSHRSGGGMGESLSFIMRDVSRQKQVEAEKIESERRMQQMQRTESLGVLAGGIAHDFNNLLTTVLGNASLARVDLAPDAPEHELLTQIELAASRAGELCQQMLAYAGRSPLKFADIDLTALVEETRPLLEISTGRKIDLQLDLEKSLATVRAATPQMQQVIMNLVINAAHAIGDKTGQIVIRTHVRELEPAELAGLSLTHPLAPGAYVVLEVEDSGCGMTADTRSRIFEPFFTTRFAGHGLGLAAVHGIVGAHLGAIEVNSAPGEGTRFRVFLPAQSTASARRTDAPAPRPALRRSGLALVGDDEPPVRRIAARLLQNLGYATIEASHGAEGVARFRENSRRLALVLLDLTMPHMDGEHALAEMQRIRQSVPVIIMSGYSERLTLDRFPQSKPAGFLAKPFDRQALDLAVETALPPRPPAGAIR